MKKNILILLILSLLFSCIYLNKQHNKKLTDESISILTNLEDKVYINIYMNGNLSPNFQLLQNEVNNLLNIFKSSSNKELDFEFVSISEDKNNSKKNLYSSQKIHPIWVKNKEKFHKIYPYATINFRDNSIPILIHNCLFFDTIDELNEDQLMNSINNLEYNFIESLYLVQQNEKKKIAFLTGNGQLDSTNTWDIRNTLSKFYDVEYFDLRSFEIDQILNKPDIWKQIERLKKYKCIVIAKPTKPFFDIDKLLIDQYIMNGGRIFWLVDGTNANMNNFKGNLEFIIEENELGLSKFLSNYGAKINKDVILDENCSKSPIFYENKIAYFDWQYKPILSTNTNHIIGKIKDTLLTDFVSSISITEDNKCSILMSSSEKTNIKKCGEKVSLEIIKKPPLKFIDPQPTAVLLEGSFRSNYSKITQKKIKEKIKKNKMILASDGDMIANLQSPQNFPYPLGYYHFSRNVFDGNTNFILNSILYLCDDEILIELQNKTKLNEK